VVAVDELAIEVVSGVAVGLGMGLVGAGGAIFTVPLFGTLLGHAPKAAIVEALAVTGAIAAASGAAAACRALVDWHRVAVFGVTGFIGAQLAAPIAVRMSDAVQLMMFAAVALVAAWRMWSSASGAPATASGQDPRRALLKSAATGLGIGALTSMLGVGGGFILIPALVMLERLPMRHAVATSLVVISINAGAGLIGQWWSGGFDRIEFAGRPVAIVATCGVVGSFAGAAVASRVPQVALRRVFAALLAMVTLGMVLASVAR
jgi:hypothetical protein